MPTRSVKCFHALYSLRRLIVIMTWSSKKGSGVLFAIMAFAMTSCGTTLVNGPIVHQGDGWTVTLQQLDDGPNSAGQGQNIVFHPPRGHRFIHAYLRFRNDAAVPRNFGYDACDLDIGQQRVLPDLITSWRGLMAPIDRTETFDAKEESWRILVFSYPKGQMPGRLRCAFVTFPIPPGKAP